MKIIHGIRFCRILSATAISSTHVCRLEEPSNCVLGAFSFLWHSGTGALWRASSEWYYNKCCCTTAFRGRNTRTDGRSVLSRCTGSRVLRLMVWAVNFNGAYLGPFLPLGHHCWVLSCLSLALLMMARNCCKCLTVLIQLYFLELFMKNPCLSFNWAAD